MQYIPTIYGFKIFGQKGSKYELVYDNLGQPKNQKDIDTVLKKKTQGVMGGGALASLSGAPALQGNQAMADATAPGAGKQQRM